MLVKERVIIEKPSEEYHEQPVPPSRKKKLISTKPNYNLRKMRLLAIVIALGCATVLWNTGRTDEAGYALNNDKAALLKLQQENQQIKLELARLKSPERIQKIAKYELGMSEAKTIYYQQARKVPAPTPQKSIQKQTPTENIIGMMAGFFKRIIS